MRYFIFLFMFFFNSLSYAQDAVWLLVDTQKKIIQVKQDEKTLETFAQVSIGRKGAGYKQQVGDGITPIGTYKISHTNNNSHFRKFFGLNYPSVNDAGLALFAARISYADYLLIMQAHRNDQLPPQNTALGGLIGIHGLGKGNKKVHGIFDWTRGCVAVSNQQIDKLAKWVYKGMRVQIK
ncbi:MAG: L,D-transpeptidase family protein [Methyloprofundus sp.]|nr:L,D-transpeptidase family protein [Methyloprofundus sp.]